jgi:hypothetical protein
VLQRSVTGALFVDLPAAGSDAPDDAHPASAATAALPAAKFTTARRVILDPITPLGHLLGSL